MRLVLDTNTALSGLLWSGTPGRLIDAAEAQRIELASSAALAAQVDLIVSGDARLLDLKSFLGIEIVTAAAAVERLEAQRED